MALSSTFGIARQTAEATIILIADRTVWIEPAHGGRLKFPLRMLPPDTEAGARILFTQVGDTIHKVERLS